MYHNTTNQKGEELKQSKEKALTQYEAIKKLFKSNDCIYTPSQVWKILYNENTPITSVRRAISDLTSDGILIKTTRQKAKGMYGRPEYYWKLDKK